MSEELQVRYECPFNETHPPRTFKKGETLIIGRAPKSVGWRLCEAAYEISRDSVEVELTGEGIRIKNLNTVETLNVTVKRSRSRSHQIERGDTLIVSRNCEIVIEAIHRFKCEMKTEIDPPQGQSEGPTTRQHSHNQEKYNEMTESYKELCAALVVAWFFDNLNDIARETTPTNAQLKILIDASSMNALERRIEHTKEQIVERWSTPQQKHEGFHGMHSKQQLAQWLMQHSLVTLDDVEKLPGLNHFFS